MGKGKRGAKGSERQCAIVAGNREIGDQRRRERVQGQHEVGGAFREEAASGGPEQKAENHAQQDVEGARAPSYRLWTRVDGTSHAGLWLDVDVTADCKQGNGAD